MRRIHLLLPGLLLAAACSPPEDERPPEDQRPPVAEAEATAATPGEAGDLLRLASIARGFPTLGDMEGRPLARGDFAQWVEEDGLHMRIRYDFEDNRRIEEVAVFGLRPGIVQTRWSWVETRQGQALRRFEVDFDRRTARGEKREEGEEEVERWAEEVDVEPGRSFAGFGFTVALKAFRDRLVAGEVIELEAVAFTPGPRVVGVELSHQGEERMRMGGRTVTGDRFEIEPQIPFIAELFVDVPATRIWLTSPPAEFLRWEGPLGEPDDPVVRVDVLPGEESGPAEPVETGDET